MPPAFRSTSRLGKGPEAPLHPRVGSDSSAPMYTSAASRRRAAMSEASSPRPKNTAPWRGRKRVKDAKTSFISVRCTAKERSQIDETARQAGLSIGAYLRALALGSAGPRAVRRPPIERKELARLLGHLGKVGSNLNQLAHAFNREAKVPGLGELKAIRLYVVELRDAVMEALGRARRSDDH